MSHKTYSLQNKIIGIVGGVGVYAGNDLANKIFALTNATSDQEHLPLLLASFPELIVDRTEFLTGHVQQNPALGIFEVIRTLERSGAELIGIPCNTAHAPEIFDVLLQLLSNAGSRVTVVNMLEVLVEEIVKHYPNAQNVGIVSTLGTYRTNVYPNLLDNVGLTAVIPDEGTQIQLHNAIYDTEYGIKSIANPVSDKARTILQNTVLDLIAHGSHVVVLGCTEVPLALTEKEVHGITLIDPTEILAKKLISLAAPQKLK